jgi:hypothetical protein
VTASRSTDTDARAGAAPVTALGLFGSELRRLRLAQGVSQDRLAPMVLHSRGLIGRVELGQRWPPCSLADRCDEVLHGDGALTRLWPLVDQERRAARRIVGELTSEARVTDLRELVLRLAVLTGTDLSILSIPDPAGPDLAGPDLVQDEAVRSPRHRSG